MSADPQLSQIVEWGFMGLLSGSISFAVVFLRKIADSVNKLNTQVATIIERTSGHERAIENHESRLYSLETRKNHR